MIGPLSPMPLTSMLKLAAVLLLTLTALNSYAHRGLSEDEFIHQTKQGTLGNPDLNELDKQREIQSQAQWDEAEIVELTLEDNLYDPDQIELVVGRNYRLRIKNLGPHRHDLIGNDLFTSIVIYELRGAFGRIVTPHIDAILLENGQEIEIRLTPMKSGEFPFVCTVTGHHDDGMEGVINISPDHR